jgi:hypothetical protein
MIFGHSDSLLIPWVTVFTAGLLAQVGHFLKHSGCNDGCKGLAAEVGEVKLGATNPDCYFCNKLLSLNDLPPEDVVWQFPHSVALLGPWQLYHGYCVLVARTHAAELSRLDASERRAYLDEMCLLARAVECSATRCRTCTGTFSRAPPTTRRL